MAKSRCSVKRANWLLDIGTLPYIMRLSYLTNINLAPNMRLALEIVASKLHTLTSLSRCEYSPMEDQKMDLNYDDCSIRDQRWAQHQGGAFIQERFVCGVKS